MPTENAIDQAITDAAALVGELVKARQELGVSAVFADESMAKATAALAALGQARSAVVAAHNELAESKLRVGIRTKLAGAGDKPPQQQARPTRIFAKRAKLRIRLSFRRIMCALGSSKGARHATSVVGLL